MKRWFISAALVVACGASATRAEAGSYLFERSYYSHTPEKPVQVGPRAPIGGPQFTRPQGVAATSGWRMQRNQIRVGGQIVDQTYIWDTWIQFQEKH